MTFEPMSTSTPIAAGTQSARSAVTPVKNATIMRPLMAPSLLGALLVRTMSAAAVPVAAKRCNLS